MPSASSRAVDSGWNKQSLPLQAGFQLRDLLLSAYVRAHTDLGTAGGILCVCCFVRNRGEQVDKRIPLCPLVLPSLWPTLILLFSPSCRLLVQPLLPATQPLCPQLIPRPPLQPSPLPPRVAHLGAFALFLVVAGRHAVPKSQEASPRTGTLGLWVHRELKNNLGIFSCLLLFFIPTRSLKHCYGMSLCHGNFLL